MIRAIIILYLLLIFSPVIAQKSEEEWNIVTLKEYFEQRLRDLQTAVDKAETFSTEKFANTNEWRNSLEGLTRTYMPRIEYESNMRSIDDRITANDEAIKKMQNLKQGGNVVWAYIIGGAGLFIGILSLMQSYNVSNKFNVNKLKNQ